MKLKVKFQDDVRCSICGFDMFSIRFIKAGLFNRTAFSLCPNCLAILMAYLTEINDPHSDVNEATLDRSR